jgi:hypothetical protein
MQKLLLDGKKAERVNRIIAMVTLILLPLLMAAMLWWVMPSGYKASRLQKEEQNANILTGWQPLQPALKQVVQCIYP